MQGNFTNIDEYISGFDEEIQILLQKIRTIIAQSAPNAHEVISYNMPAFKQNGVLVYFAANKNHIGFYPTGQGVLKFQDEITNYKSSKGAIQFPYNQELPKELISKIVKFRVQSDIEKTLKKKK